LAVQGSSLTGKAKVSADMAAFFDMQLEQKRQRGLLEQKMDHVLLEFNKEKAKEHEIEEEKKKEAKLALRKGIDQFNHHMLQHGKQGKLPASQECGNLFAHRLEKGDTGNVSHDEVRDALLKQIEIKDKLKIAQKQKDSQFESLAIQQANREQEVFEAQVKHNKVSKQQQAREVFIRQMEERRGQQLPSSISSEFNMLPGKSDDDSKKERRLKAQQLLEEQMVLIEIRNQQLAKQREHEAAWSLEQQKQSLMIDHQDKMDKALRLKSLQQQNKQEWLQQMKDKQIRALSEKQDVQFGNLFGN